MKFKLFTRKIPNPHPVGHYHDVYLKKVVYKILRLQTRCADWLQDKSNRISLFKKKIMLLLFILSISGYCLSVMFSAIQKQEPTISIDNGKRNTHQQINPIYPEKNIRIAHKNIEQFKAYMNALTLSEAGKATYDSILTARPGLMDSIKLLLDAKPSSVKNNYRSKTK